MALSVQKFREIVFQLLYSRAFEKSDVEGIVPLLMREQAITKKNAWETVNRAQEIWEKREDLDAKIEAHSTDFPLERIGMVEQALLRQGIYEMDHTDLPPKVAINEAMRLAKKFSTPESVSFVNALLDAVYKLREDAAIPTEQTPV